ncbi:MAG TPA: hypothetical protein PLA31_06225 [Clostridia bacterium]|jgi:cell division septum initiation protein DivIVA|nr:hypothetical protein [Clostridia bacterium]HQA97402.1 hypothetical protein [Clostridia bacterium]HUM61020.1 hypothetical protein [Clostridia bacterium]
MSKTEVFALADELTLLLKNAKKIPLTDTVMVNQSNAVDLLQRLISSYDPSLENAQVIINNEAHILADAKAKAEETIQQSMAQAQGTVNESNNYAQTTKHNADAYAEQTRKAAEDEASAMLADAQTRAHHMVEDAKAQADELVSQTTVLARAEAQAQEILENANQHAQALRSQTQQELDGVLGHVDNTIAAQLNELRLIRQNLAGARYDSDEN